MTIRIAHRTQLGGDVELPVSTWQVVLDTFGKRVPQHGMTDQIRAAIEGKAPSAYVRVPLTNEQIALLRRIVN